MFGSHRTQPFSPSYQTSPTCLHHNKSTLTPKTDTVQNLTSCFFQSKKETKRQCGDSPGLRSDRGLDLYLKGFSLPVRPGLAENEITTMSNISWAKTNLLPSFWPAENYRVINASSAHAIFLVVKEQTERERRERWEGDRDTEKEREKARERSNRLRHKHQQQKKKPHTKLFRTRCKDLIIKQNGSNQQHLRGLDVTEDLARVPVSSFAGLPRITNRSVLVVTGDSMSSINLEPRGT